MGGWQQVVHTVGEEFSDLPDAAGVTRVVMRLTLAAVLGGVLGYERESRGKAAGLRTHMLVAVGAALFVLIPQQAGATPADVSRIIQGLVAGVGFLGAGSIIKGKSDGDGNGEGQDGVVGLTTAAGIWLTAAIGIAAGMGREATALLSTALAVIVLTAVPRVANLFGPRK